MVGDYYQGASTTPLFSSTWSRSGKLCLKMPVKRSQPVYTLILGVVQ